jgi:hypothetical protein
VALVKAIALPGMVLEDPDLGTSEFFHDGRADPGTRDNRLPDEDLVLVNHQIDLIKFDL